MTYPLFNHGFGTGTITEPSSSAWAASPQAALVTFLLHMRLVRNAVTRAEG